jgi:hypothetical protein
VPTHRPLPGPVASFCFAWQTSNGCTTHLDSLLDVLRRAAGRVDLADISATLVFPGKSLSFLQFSIELVLQLLFFFALRMKGSLVAITTC